jgi:hypothetical protein
MFHRPLAAAVFMALATTALPSLAAVGARCPADTPTYDFTSQYTNNILRCQRHPVAPTFCPVTHPVYVKKSGRDECRLNPSAPVLIGVAPTYAVQCLPNLTHQVDGGAGNRDRCRAANSAGHVPPVLGNY